LWDVRHIVVVAQRPVDWRLAAGQLNTVYESAGTLARELHMLAAESAPMRPFSCLTASLAAAAAADSLVHKGVI